MPLPPPAAGHTAVVTGASSGIGREVARLLAGRGYPLTVVARRGAALDDLVRELDGGAGVTPLVADLTTAAGRDRLDGVLGRASVLVNCAGIGPVAPVADGGRAAELACVELNVAATTDLTSRAVAGMVARRCGAVLNVASTAAFLPVPGQAVYAASKAFVLQYTCALRRELAGTGVVVGALCPGPVRTGFAAANGSSDEQLFHGLPERMILTAEQVARAGVDGLDRGRDIIVPGPVNAVMSAVTGLLPRRLVTALLAAGAPGLAGRSPAGTR